MASPDPKVQYGQRVTLSLRQAIIEASRVMGSDNVVIDNDVVIGCLVNTLAMQAASGKFQHCTLEQMANDIRVDFINQVRIFQKLYGDQLTQNTVRRN